MEISLTSFQNDLGLVSAEIETLQNRSVALNTRLENRKVVEKLLGPAVEEISISPAVIKIISEAPIDENWLKALAELEKSLTALDGKLRGSNTVRAIDEVKPLMDNLTSMVSDDAYSTYPTDEDVALRHYRRYNEYVTSWSLKSSP